MERQYCMNAYPKPKHVMQAATNCLRLKPNKTVKLFSSITHQHPAFVIVTNEFLHSSYTDSWQKALVLWKTPFFVIEKLLTQNIGCLQLTYLHTVTPVPPFPFYLTALLFSSINVIPTLRLNWWKNFYKICHCKQTCSLPFIALFI